MQLYSLALVVHFLGLIGLFGGFVVFHRAVPRLRAATTGEAAEPWADLVAATGRMHQGGLAFLLVSGLVMAYLRWRGAFPWMVTALLGLVAIGALTGGVTGRWIRRVNAEVRAAAARPLSAAARELIDASAPREAAATANGMALALLWIMTGKPGWIGSLAALVIAAVAGWAIGRMAGRAGARSVSDADARPVR